ncbi:hypothetical protein CPB86DRAFT_390372 [Serendipita vermifera]|nr:hypothetical protein CPB86DRAFT_390372 [Serendipita vermifera]
MPQLDDGAARYKDCVGERLEVFKPNSFISKKEKKPKSVEVFQHKLRYDAESVFWLLLWWSMQAKPLYDRAVSDRIKHSHWVNFTAENDERRFFIDGISPGTCHPDYEPLETLLSSMAEQLKGDPEILDDSDIRKHDEYLHEAFQRLIFDFLSEHLKAQSEFLTLEKSEKRRLIENEEPMKQPLPTFTLPTTRLPSPPVISGRGTGTLKRTRKDGDDGEYEETSRSTKRSRREGPEAA